MPSVFIVMQAYGPEEALRQSLLALLSLSEHHTPAGCPEIWIYTDQPDWYSAFNCPLPLRFRTMDAATIRAWRGAIDFVHRVKIEVLRDFARDHEGAVLYVDTDVLFIQSLAPVLRRIAGGGLFMHVSEGRLADEGTPMIAKLHRFLQKSRPMDAAADAVMWNAGVLGFHTAQKALLDAVLDYTDAVHPRFPKHIVEQWAFSLFFTRAGVVHCTCAPVFHYWIIKEHRDIVASFFDRFSGASWDDLVRYRQLIQIPELIQQKTSFFINRSVAGKVRQLKWTPALPDWDELLRQL